MPIPRWERFLTDTFGADADDQQMIAYLQLLLGYSVTGDVGGQVLPFLFGSGKNGKSVLLDVLMKLLGDYADAAPPGFLMARPYEGHPTDLAELHGRRVIVCSEVKPGDKFDEGRVKLLTGGDRIKARRMRQDFFGFNPTHKLWLLGNHRPEVGTGGFAFWRRMRLIPFERVVPDHRKIDNLADLLVTEEGPGILTWLVDGARRYLAGDRDLTGPERVRIATSAYAETEDHTGRFYDECCRLDTELRAEQTALYAAYRAWCQNEGAPAMSSRAFAARTRELVGLASPKEMILSNQRKHYPGSDCSPTRRGTAHELPDYRGRDQPRSRHRVAGGHRPPRLRPPEPGPAPHPQGEAGLPPRRPHGRLRPPGHHGQTLPRLRHVPPPCFLAPAPRPRQPALGPVRQERPSRSCRPAHPRTPCEGLQDRTF
jgi:phage/plasmid primase, P4 family, C-terminal domain